MQDQVVKDTCGWVEHAGPYAAHPVLSQDQSADWVVIGGGFTGLAAARRIVELDAGARVVLIDGKRIGQGASSRNSGFVVANGAPDEGHFANGRARADYAALNAFNRDGVAALKGLIHAHGIDCQWDEGGVIHGVASRAHVRKIANYAARFRELGVDHTVMDASALKARLGTSFYQYGVENRGGALVQPAMLMRGLVANLPEAVELFENTPVTGVVVEDGRVVVQCGGGAVRARRVVVAVNGFLERLALLPRVVFPLALTASLTRVLTADERAKMSGAAPWGVLSPVSMGATVRLTNDGRILMRNTAEFSRDGIDRRALGGHRGVHSRGLRARFPWLGGDVIEHTWSGTLGISRNSKPVFEALDDKIFVVGCYNAAGVARGTSMGRLIVDRALGEPSELLNSAMAITKPSRIPPKPFFDIGIWARMGMERRAGRSEG